MSNPISITQLVNASQDAQSLGEFVGIDSTPSDVTTRLGITYPNIPKIVQMLLDGGLLDAKPFDTLAILTGAKLSNGAYALVTNDPNLETNGLYKIVDGKPLQQKMHDIARLVELISKSDAGYNQVIHDDMGNVYDFAIASDDSIAWGMSDGFMLAPNHKLDFAGVVAGFSDESGQMPLAIKSDGTVVIAKLAGKDAQDKAIKKASLHPAWRKKDINHVIIYGQSLSEGSTSNRNEPLSGMEISKTQPYANLMLAGGTRAEPQHNFYSADFAPLIEQSVGQISDSSNAATYNASQNESPVAGVCNEFTRRCLARTQKASANDFVMIGTASGRGGQNVEALINGTQWAVLERHIKDVIATAKAQGKSSAVSAICYIQGEANHHAILRGLGSFDATITADVYEYQNRVQALIDKIDALILDNEQQDFLPYVVTYQTEAHRSYEVSGQSLNVNPIATAQWFMSKSNPRVILAVPVYAIPKNDRDKVHTTHVGSWLMGAYFARAMEYTLHAKMGKWRPLEPVRYDWTDTHCDIEFYVPCGKLIFDDYFCAIQPNLGFDVWRDGVLQDTAIKSVELLDAKTVRVSFNAVQTGAQLSYCLGRETTKPNAWGNLRDSHGDTDTATDPLGNIHKLHNPSVMFNIHQQRGSI